MNRGYFYFIFIIDLRCIEAFKEIAFHLHGNIDTENNTSLNNIKKTATYQKTNKFFKVCEPKKIKTGKQ